MSGKPDSNADRRLVVEVLWGPHAGRKAAIAVGAVLRVGRGDRADLILPGDEGLAAIHFEIAWDGQVGRVRDLGKAQRGVEIAGEKVSEATIAPGAWIRASKSDFRVWLEGAPRPPPVIDRPPPEDEEEEGLRELERVAEENEVAFRARITAVLKAHAAEGRLHAVLDGARDARIGELLASCMDTSRSLYEGAEGEAMADIAPYVVRLSADSPLLERLIVEGWGKRWGVFFTTSQPFKETRRHLRRFLMVTDDESGERLYFRYYDPAVLRLFLGVCTIRQAEELWGDIDVFFLESEDGNVERHDRDVAIAAAASRLASGSGGGAS